MKQIEELAKKILELRKEHEDLQKSKANVGTQIYESEQELIRLMKDQNLKKLETSDGHTIDVGFNTQVKVLDEEAMFDFLETEGFGKVIKRTIHHQTRNRIVKDIQFPEDGEGQVVPGVEIKIIDKVKVD